MKTEISQLSSWSHMVALAAMGILAACGDTVENVNQINQMGMAVVDSAKDLPKCTDENEGEQVYVKGESFARICDGENWIALDGLDSDFSCKTEELKDKNGLKIVCNGDSIGVVLNGEKGETGEGCTISGQTDSTVTIACGDKKLTMNMDGGFSVVEAENDSEKVAVSLDSLAGYTQKGPFLKGSTVYLYELSDGRTLKQTNGNFTSKITRDDGRYKFTARDLVSQYAMLVVDGFYRNEVTGQKSDASLRLTALTDMRKRSSANVNLLTHLEFDRVYRLVTRGDSTGKKLTVKQAKRQAQKEILKQFHIELDSNTDAEDMDVFGKTDADAALLAVSILLQGDSGTTDLSVLLTEISNDIAEYGKWKNDSAKAAIADWAMVADTANKLAIFSNNVTNWGLGAAPDFAKFVRDFWYREYGIDSCKRDGEVAATKNEKSDYYKTQMRFICKSGAWKPATDIEKDTYQWEDGFDGEIKVGDVTKTRKYDYDGKQNAWRYATPQEAVLGGCTETREADISQNTGKVNGTWYICKGREWKSTNNIIVDTQGWVEGSDGDLKKGDSTDVFYKYDEALDKWVTATYNDTTLKLMGCTTNRTGEIGKSPTNEAYYVCKNSDWQKAQEIDYETYGNKCTADSVGKVISGVVTSTNKYYCSASGWVSLMGWNWSVPKEARLNPEIEYDTIIDPRDQKVYKIVTIAPEGSGYSMTWFAENLNYADSIKTPSLKGRNWCYSNVAKNCDVGGRLYTWAAAIDSVKLATDANNPQDCGYGKTCTLPAKVQGICPTGWHLPSKSEWEALFTAVGGQSKASKILKSQTGWSNNGNGTDAFGFAALPAGLRYNSGDFDLEGTNADFWSSTEDDANVAYRMYLYYDGENAYLSYSNKDNAFSVRCLRD